MAHSRPQVVGCNWVELPAGAYQLSPVNTTFCQIEAHIQADKLVSHAPEGESLNACLPRNMCARYKYSMQCHGTPARQHAHN